MKKTDISKDKRISNEISRLTKIFENIGEDKRSTCLRLIENAGFLAVVLQDLQKDMLVNGLVDTYQNGENQSGRKPSVESQLYKEYLKNYTTIIKQLVALLPPSDRELAKLSSDPMLEYLNS